MPARAHKVRMRRVLSYGTEWQVPIQMKLSIRRVDLELIAGYIYIYISSKVKIPTSKEPAIHCKLHLHPTRRLPQLSAHYRPELLGNSGEWGRHPVL